jgi:hypothetical protein
MCRYCQAGRDLPEGWELMSFDPCKSCGVGWLAVIEVPGVGRVDVHDQDEAGHGNAMVDKWNELMARVQKDGIAGLTEDELQTAGYWHLSEITDAMYPEDPEKYAHANVARALVRAEVYARSYPDAMAAAIAEDGYLDEHSYQEAVWALGDSLAGVSAKGLMDRIMLKATELLGLPTTRPDGTPMQDGDWLSPGGTVVPVENMVEVDGYQFTTAWDADLYRKSEDFQSWVQERYHTDTLIASNIMDAFHGQKLVAIK